MGFYHTASATVRVPVAVSACLAGLPVRYDGRDRPIPGEIAAWLQAELHLIPVCPEIDAGLGVPRPPVQLVMSANGSPPRALGRDDPSLDVSHALRRNALRSARQLRSQHICGYIWKSRSPSCGLGSTPLFDAAGTAAGLTSGLQARLFRKRMPWLVQCEDEDLETLQDAKRFAWQCRLVFDVMTTRGAELPALHRHYRTLTEIFSEREQHALDCIAQMGRRKHYLSALRDACLNAPGDALRQAMTASIR